MSKNRITVLLVDDHAMIRMGLLTLLGTRPELAVVGDAGDGKTALRKALALRPDVIVMDLVMPEMDGAEATKRILEAWPEAKILILTSYGSSDGIAAALKAGARGAILKSADVKDFIAAIKSVATGRESVSDEIRQIISDDPPVPELSPRQQEILQSLTRGLPNNDIARQLGISASVVREHLITIFAKLGAANRAEAVAIALRKHLLKT